MALSHRLELRQGQGLVITPQLQQAIKLLQLSSLELDAYVEGELERNPLLQRDEGEDHREPETDAGPTETSGETPLDQMSEASAAQDLDARHEDLYDDASPGERATGDGAEAAQEGYQTGGAVDWSRAGPGGSFEHDGEGMDGVAPNRSTEQEAAALA